MKKNLINRYSKVFKSNKRLFFLLLWLSSVPLLSSSLLSVLIIQHESLIAGFGLFSWILIFVLTIVGMVTAITPTTFISLVSGYFLGIQAILPVVICYQIASWIGYELAKKLDHDFVESLVKEEPRVGDVIHNVRNKKLSVIILSRVSPVLPFSLMNVVLSVAGVPLKEFLLGGLIGMLPRTLFSIWVGAQASYLMSAIQYKTDFVWIILVAVIIFFMLYWMLRPSRQKTH